MRIHKPTCSFALGTLLVLAAVAPSTAQEGYELSGDYVFSVGGDIDSQAEVYVLGRGVSYLILSDELESPLLIEPRAGQVEALNMMKVARQDDGSVDLLPSASMGPVSAFQIDEDGVSFTLDGTEAALRNKPPYLGDAEIEDLLVYSASYKQGAEGYSVSDPILRQLREESRPVRVRVFFGSWCPYCQQVVPRILKVAQALEGSAVDVEFYGLPRDIASDDEATRLDISGVPTGVVFVGDREVGRISGGTWKIPELAIKNALDETS